MSGEQPPVDARDFVRLLKHLGFELRSTAATSHEQWAGKYGGETRLVTVDRPKSPFAKSLLASMIKQIGMTKKEFYATLRKL